LEAVSFSQRMRHLAEARGSDRALTLYRSDGTTDSVSFSEFRTWTLALANRLRNEGVNGQTTVVVSAGNTLEHFVTCYAAWQLGCMVLPINRESAVRERELLVSLLESRFVISDWAGGADLTPETVRDHRRDRTAKDFPDIVPAPGKAVGSGGSTGVPKLIVDPVPFVKVPGRSMGVLGDAVGFHEASSQLVPGAVFHNMPFTWSAHGLFEGQHVVVLERFDAGRLLEAIELEKVEFMTMVPTMMRRVARHVRAFTADLSSLKAVMHGGAPCSDSLKATWIEMVGAEVVREAFGSTEGVGTAVIRGDEWLSHPGSVGRPVDSEIRILDPAQREVATGTLGEMYWRSLSPGPTYYYLGDARSKVDPDGFTSVGDMGWVDDEGYVYSADRRVDLILTGGANVFPAEIEGVLLDHPKVIDAAVIGVADPEWGQRVHAVVGPVRPGAVTTEDLDRWCRDYLSAYKVPKTYEFVNELPRDEAGKIRRAAMAEARRNSIMDDA